MNNSKGMTQSDPYNKSGSFSPSLKPSQGSRVSFQRTRFSESSPPRQQPLRYSPSPIRALKHSEQHSAGEESDHEHEIPSGSASKAFNEMPPPKSTKRKVRLDDSIDPEGDFKRTVKARSSSFTESSPVPSTGGKNDETILMVIKGIESLAEAKFQLCTIASKKDDLKRIAKDGLDKMSEAAQKRYNEVCKEVDSCTKKVEEQKTNLFTDFEKLVKVQESHLDKSPLLSVEKFLQEVEEEAQATPTERPRESNNQSISDTLVEQSHTNLNEDKDKDIQSLIHATLESTIPDLIEQAFNRRQSNGTNEGASPARDRENISSNGIDSLTHQTYASQETELVQLRGMVTELQQDWLKKNEEFEELQRKMNDFHENMSIQERFLSFNTAAILRHEGSLLNLI